MYAGPLFGERPQVNLRPFFSYYGGKWRDAPRYPAPRHGAIVEPFAGSAGYAVRYAHLDVILCDLDPAICGVWDYLIRVSPREVLSIPDVPDGGTVDDLALCPEAAALVGFWMNRGAATPRKSPSAWARSGVRPGSFWGDRVRQTIAAQVAHIRHWTIIQCGYRQSPRPEATWFVDPPYQVAGTHYRHGSSAIDFSELGDWCRNLPGQAIVCENAGAEWLPCEPLASARATRPGTRSMEALWTTQPTPTPPEE